MNWFGSAFDHTVDWRSRFLLALRPGDETYIAIKLKIEDDDDNDISQRKASQHAVAY